MGCQVPTPPHRCCLHADNFMCSIWSRMLKTRAGDTVWNHRPHCRMSYFLMEKSKKHPVCSYQKNSALDNTRSFSSHPLLPTLLLNGAKYSQDRSKLTGSMFQRPGKCWLGALCNLPRSLTSKLLGLKPPRPDGLWIYMDFTHSCVHTESTHRHAHEHWPALKCAHMGINTQSHTWGTQILQLYTYRHSHMSTCMHRNSST